MRITKKDLKRLIENYLLTEKTYAKRLDVTGKFQKLINKMLEKKNSSTPKLQVDNQWGAKTDKAFREVLKLYGPPEFANKTWSQIASEQGISAGTKSAYEYLENMFDDTMSGQRPKRRDGGYEEEEVEPFVPDQEEEESEEEESEEEESESEEDPEPRQHGNLSKIQKKRLKKLFDEGNLNQLKTEDLALWKKIKIGLDSDKYTVGVWPIHGTNYGPAKTNGERRAREAAKEINPSNPSPIISARAWSDDMKYFVAIAHIGS